MEQKSFDIILKDIKMTVLSSAFKNLRVETGKTWPYL